MSLAVKPKTCDLCPVHSFFKSCSFNIVFLFFFLFFFLSLILLVNLFSSLLSIIDYLFLIFLFRCGLGLPFVFLWLFLLNNFFLWCRFSRFPDGKSEGVSWSVATFIDLGR